MLIDKGLLEIECSRPHPGEDNWEAKAAVKADLTGVIPYINSVTKKPEYLPNLPVIVWRREGRRVAVRPHEIGVDEVPDAETGRAEIARLADWINDLWERRDEIEPLYEPRSFPPLMSVLKQLPMNNCGDCALPTCTAFAAALINGEKEISDCPALEEPERTGNAEALREMGLS